MNKPETASGQSLLIVAAALMMSGFALSPLNAADLGGDCCADLEERVAELEATIVRKGNRSVHLIPWLLPLDMTGTSSR